MNDPNDPLVNVLAMPIAGENYPGNDVRLFVVHEATDGNGQLRFLVRQRADSGDWELPGGRASHGNYLEEVCTQITREDHGIEVDPVSDLQQLLALSDIVRAGNTTWFHWLVPPFAVYPRFHSASFDRARFSAVDWVPGYLIGSMDITDRTRLVLNRLPQ